MCAALLGLMLVCSMRRKPGATDLGVAVGGDLADGGGAVEADVKVAGAGDFDAGYALGERGGELRGELGRDDAGGLAGGRLASSKATGRASSPSAMVGGCSTTSCGRVTPYSVARRAWMRAISDCWTMRYMLAIHRSERLFA